MLQAASAQSCNCDNNEVEIVLRGTIPGFKVAGGGQGPADQIKVQIQEQQDVEFQLSTDPFVGCEIGTVSFSCGLEYETIDSHGNVTDWKKGRMFSADTINMELKPVAFRLRRQKEPQDTGDDEGGDPASYIPGLDDQPGDDSPAGSATGGEDAPGTEAPPTVSFTGTGIQTLSPAGFSFSIPLGSVATGSSGGAPYLEGGVLSWSGPITPDLAKPAQIGYHGLDEVAGCAASIWSPAIAPKVTFGTPSGYPDEKHGVTPTRLFRVIGYTTNPSTGVPFSSATSTSIREYVRANSSEAASVTLSGAPVSSWDISPVANGIKIVETVNGVARTFSYTAPSTTQMIATTGLTSRWVLLVPPSSAGQPYSVQIQVSRAGVEVSKTIDTYSMVNGAYLLQSETQFDDLSTGAGLTTTYGYYPSGAGSASGQLWWTSRPDGSWEVYQYDLSGNTVAFTPFESETLLDTSHTDINTLPIVSAPGIAGGAGRYRRSEHPANGVSQEYVASLADGVLTLIQEGDLNSELDAENSPTDAIPDDLPIKQKGRTIYYSNDIPDSSDNHWLCGKTILTYAENFSATYYQYQKSGDQLTITETTGAVIDSGSPTVDIWSFQTVPNLSRKVVSIYGSYGVTSRETLYHTGAGFTSARLENFFYLNGRYQRTEVGGIEVDRLDRPNPLTEVRKNNQGMVTTSQFDADGNLISTEAAAGGGVPAITTTYEVNGLVTTTRINGVISSIETRDGLNRVIRVQNETGAVTAYSYPNGGRDRQTTLPGGIVRYTENYLDGTLKAHSGSGWVQEFHSTGITTTTGGICQISSSGSSTGHTARIVSRYLDLSGRVIEQVTPSPSPAGGVIEEDYTYQYGVLKSIAPKQIDAANAVTNLPVKRFFAVDPISILSSGSPVRSNAVIMGGEVMVGLDVDGTTGLTPGTDRVERRTVSYELSGTSVIKRTRDYQYPSAASPLITETVDSIGFTSPGAGSYSTSQKITQPSGRSVTQTMVITPATATTVRTADDSATTSTVDRVDTTVEGYLQSLQQAGSSRNAIYSYDIFGRVSTYSDSRGALTFTYYRGDSQPASVVDQLGRVTSYSYYGPGEAHAGMLKLITSPGGITEQKSYNDRGQVTQISGSGTYAQDFTYDDWGNELTLQTHGSQPSLTRFTYQSATGMLSSKRFNDGNPGGKGFDYEYSPDGKITKKTSGRNISAVFTFDPATRDLTGVSYSDSQTLDLSYSNFDSMGRPGTISESKPASEGGPYTNTQTLSYDVGTGLATITYDSAHRWLKGVKVQQKTNDASGRSMGFDLYAGGTQYASQGYHYDAGSRVDQVNSLDFGSILSYLPGTDRVNDVVVKAGTSGSSPVVHDRTSTIDLLNQTIGVINKAGASAGSLATVASVGHLYDPAGRRKTARREDGAWWDYQYNNRSEVTSAVKRAVSGNAIPSLSYAYDYDGIGNRTTSSAGTGSGISTRNYTPDALNEYDGITHTGKFSILSRSDADVSATAANASFDGAEHEDNLYGARMTASNGTTGAVVNATVKRAGVAVDTVSTWVPPSNLVPTYDLDGNLTGDGRWTYTWDGENRLISMTSTAMAVTAGAPNTTLTFEYDWMGRRIGKAVTTAGATTYSSFAYDGWNPVAEWSRTSQTSALTYPLRTYSWGPDISSTGKVDIQGAPVFQNAGGVGGLLACTYYNSASSKEFFVPSFDANGNVIAWTNSAGSLLQRMDYDPYGNTVMSERLGTAATLAKLPPIGFSTKFRDVQSGLYYYGYRYYDPVAGRWTSRDPIGEDGGVNLYSFVKGNPIGNVDYLGNALPQYDEDTNALPLDTDTATPAGESGYEKAVWRFNPTVTATSGGNESLKLDGDLTITLFYDPNKTSPTSRVDKKGAKINSSGRSVEEHERIHAWIDKSSYNAMAVVVNTWEGDYCPSCGNRAKLVAQTIYRLCHAISDLKNAQFDNSEYGRGTGSFVDKVQKARENKKDALEAYKKAKCHSA